MDESKIQKAPQKLEEQEIDRYLEFGMWTLHHGITRNEGNIQSI